MLICFPSSGDPARYHASHIVVLKSDGADLASHDLCALLRLGNSVKKVVVLAAESGDRSELFFTTMAWAGVGWRFAVKQVFPFHSLLNANNAKRFVILNWLKMNARPNAISEY